MYVEQCFSLGQALILYKTVVVTRSDSGVQRFPQAQ